MFRNFQRILSTTLLSAALALPAFAQRGSADFTRYVAVGDSLTAGFSSASLVLSHQQWSYPSVIARQAGTVDFQQPLVSEPGIPAEYHLQSISPLIIGPKSSGNGQPINLMLPRPYNNLGIPGARVADLLTRTGAEQDASNPFYQVVLRGLGPAVGQAAALHPTFVTIWIGNNDVLGAVTSGIAIEGVTLTPLDVFAGNYLTLLETLTTAAPTAGMVAATVPPVTEIPFASVLPPVLLDPATRQPVPGPDGKPIFLIAEFGDGTVGQLGPGAKLTLAAQSALATGYGIPAALAPMIPLPNVGKPLPNQVVLDPAELQAIEAHRNEINSLITTAAQSYNIPVLNFDPIFEAYAEGVEIAGISFSLDFLTGGIMSYDGIHPTDIGYMLIANEFIEKINESYDTSIPHASLVAFFANNAPKDDDLLVFVPGMELNLLEAPWTEFKVPFAESAITTPETTEPEAPVRRRTSRGGRG